MDQPPQFHVPVTFLADQLETPCVSVCMIDFDQGILRLANRKRFGVRESATFSEEYIPFGSESDTHDLYVARLNLKGVIKYNASPSFLDHPQNWLHHIIFDRTPNRVHMNILFRGNQTTIGCTQITGDEVQRYHNLTFGTERNSREIRMVKQTTAYNTHGEPGGIYFLIMDKEVVCVIAEEDDDEEDANKKKEEKHAYFRTNNNTAKLENILYKIQNWHFVCIPHKNLFLMVGDSDSYTFRT
jgi:hypothetical protein